MRFFEEQYLDACAEILDYGTAVMDRTGTGTKMLTNVMLEHGNVEEYFPIPVTKKLALKSVIGELLWFLEGSTSDRRLAEITYGDGDHLTIWSANWAAKPYRFPTQAKEHALDFDGARELGPVYGAQWRRPGTTSWNHKTSAEFDQIWNVIHGIKTDPFGRRHVVTAWNPHQLSQMSLPPCHMIFQFNVVGDKIDLLMMQRSGDMFLGIPFNMASYALLLKIIAKETGYRAGKVSIVIGNAHIYLNHVDQMEQQIRRKNTTVYKDAERSFAHFSPHVKTPRILINNDSQLFTTTGDIGYSIDDFTVVDYDPLPAIKGDMAV